MASEGGQQLPSSASLQSGGVASAPAPLNGQPPSTAPLVRSNRAGTVVSGGSVPAQYTGTRQAGAGIDGPHGNPASVQPQQQHGESTVSTSAGLLPSSVVSAGAPRLATGSGSKVSGAAPSQAAAAASPFGASPYVASSSGSAAYHHHQQYHSGSATINGPGHVTRHVSSSLTAAKPQSSMSPFSSFAAAGPAATTTAATSSSLGASRVLFTGSATHPASLGGAASGSALAPPGTSQQPGMCTTGQAQSTITSSGTITGTSNYYGGTTMASGHPGSPAVQNAINSGRIYAPQGGTLIAGSGALKSGLSTPYNPSSVLTFEMPIGFGGGSVLPSVGAFHPRHGVEHEFPTGHSGMVVDERGLLTRGQGGRASSVLVPQQMPPLQSIKDGRTSNHNFVVAPQRRSACC